jgi:hypothetical protein
MSDTYTKELVKFQYELHKQYYSGRKTSISSANLTVRMPCIPEDISENLIKFIIHNKLNDPTSSWNCKGDLLSQKNGKQECKCFTSDGPLSFTPTSDWDEIYFLDARNWINDKFVLYRISLKRTSPEWNSIKVNKTQTFEDQTKQGRRPRMGWDVLFPQISNFCTAIININSLEDIFTPVEVTE